MTITRARLSRRFRRSDERSSAMNKGALARRRRRDRHAYVRTMLAFIATYCLCSRCRSPAAGQTLIAPRAGTIGGDQARRIAQRLREVVGGRSTRCEATFFTGKMGNGGAVPRASVGGPMRSRDTPRHGISNTERHHVVMDESEDDPSCSYRCCTLSANRSDVTTPIRAGDTY